MTMTCDAIREAFSRYLQAETEVLQTRQACLLSLPIRVIDGANIEVFIEESGNGAFCVHDAGRTIGRLETSGLKLTDMRVEMFAQLAKRLGVGLLDGVFQGFARTATLQQTALSVGQCCSLALYELLRHAPFSEEERIRATVAKEMDDWSTATGIAVVKDYEVNGSVRQHTFDFLAQAKEPIAVDVLIPSYGPNVSADRYAMKVWDIEKAGVPRPKLIAVLARPEKWKQTARHVVGTLADDIAEIPEEGALLPSGLSDALSRFAAA